MPLGFGLPIRRDLDQMCIVRQVVVWNMNDGASAAFPRPGAELDFIEIAKGEILDDPHSLAALPGLISIINNKIVERLFRHFRDLHISRHLSPLQKHPNYSITAYYRT